MLQCSSHTLAISPMLKTLPEREGHTEHTTLRHLKLKHGSPPQYHDHERAILALVISFLP